jgi:hypothetical protein
MAKKSDSKSTPAVPAKRAVKPVAAKTKIAPTKTAPVKAKAVAAKTVKPKAPKAPAYTNDDIALRAYFIAEKRRAHGLHGDEHQDWVEAERQLAAESKRPKKTTKA